MKKVSFDLAKTPRELHVALSAAARAGKDLWLGGDEGTAIVRAAPDGSGGFVAEAPEALAHRLDLVGGEEEEIDVEGMDVAGDDGVPYLWLVGSHSLKRKKPELAKAGASPDEQAEADARNVKRIAKIEADGNRYLLARLPLEVARNGRSRLIDTAEYSKGRFAARLACTTRKSELLTELRDDPLFAPFLRGGIPGKDNGVDFEGLACIDARRVLLGMRGPVLRGWALLLEIEVKPKFRAPGEPGRLKLKKIGPDGRHYLRHFLDLGGLGIRDLCFDANGDLLILAGPTMVLDWPPTVFRWHGARAALGVGERFISRGKRQLTVACEGKAPPPGFDRAEGLLRWANGEVLLLYDSPSPNRYREPAIEADVLRVR